MQNSLLFPSHLSHLYYSQIPYKYPFPKYETGSPVRLDQSLKKEKEENQPEIRKKYEDFVSKLLDENKKLIELVDFQKQEILNLHRNYQDMKNLTFLDGQKSTETRNDSNSERTFLSSKEKYENIINEITHQNRSLLFEKEKLEEDNKLFMEKNYELNEENQRLHSMISQLKENYLGSAKNQEESKGKYGKIMDLITEIGEQEKNKEDLVFKILDLESKVNQLLMENEKLHKYIQETNI